MGGVLRTAAQTEGPTFSPWEEAAGIAFPAGHPLTNMIVQPQTWGNRDDYKAAAFFNIKPDLASSWEQSADGMTWTFKLRDGVKWSDGTPFTCADAKWSLDSIRTGQGLNRSPRAVHFLAVDNIQCPDDLTLVINMKRPKSGLIDIIGMPYTMVLPKHTYENNTNLMRERPIDPGTGPFTLREWIPGEKYTFVRKSDYWDKPFPYLDSLEIQILSPQAQVAGLRAGRLDVGQAYGYLGSQAETLARECQECQVYDRIVAAAWSNVMVNHQRPPWNTPEIKDAISLAIDRNKYIEVAQQGWGVLPTGGGFYPGSGWEMPYDRVKQIPGYNLETPEENKQRARDLLAQAGYQPGELKLNVGVWSISQTAIPVYVEELTAVGFDVTTEIFETARHYEAMGSANFDVHTHGVWIAGVDPDIALYEHFYTGSDRNYGRYSNPEFDRLVDEMSQTVDPELRKQRAWDAMELALREHAKMILATETYQPIVSGRIRGYMPANNTQAGYGPFFRYAHVWLAE
jgi:peptide/nickel transport system substrate-binding protein